ncbi:MAG: DUF4011 domain-containing protein [Rhizomicrobium sp.]
MRWYDADGSDIARHAPLVLIPVSLERTSASEKFKLRARPEPLATNITLQAKLRAEFGLILEDAPGEDEDFDLLAISQRSWRPWQSSRDGKSCPMPWCWDSSRSRNISCTAISIPICGRKAPRSTNIRSSRRS